MSVHQENNKSWFPFDPKSHFHAAPTVVDKTYVKKNDVVESIKERLLGGSNDGNGYVSYFSDKNGEEYDAYSLAWRYLGAFRDCGSYETNEEGSGSGSGSGDGGCSVKVLWAAYIDPRYKGGSIGEYKFYDFATNTWDDSSCETKRCARMDCHEPKTHFRLVGIFKETDGFDDWTEQLFKHQGYCLWDEDTYEFMENNMAKFSSYGCSKLYYPDYDGNSLYADTKPLPEGNITLGLYQDEDCVTPSSYTYGDYIKIYYYNYYGDANSGSNRAESFNSNIDLWNEYMNVYKVCQPCRAYSLNVDYGSGSRSGDRRLNEDGEGDEEQWGYNCYDDAGYTNCNQCYKFHTQTDLEEATVQDLEAASLQGSILEIKYKRKIYGSGGFRSPPEPVSATTVFATLMLLFFALISLLRWAKFKYCKDKTYGEAAVMLKETLQVTYNEAKSNIRSRSFGEEFQDKLCADDEATTATDSSEYDSDLVRKAMMGNARTRKDTKACLNCVYCAEREHVRNKTFMLTSLLLGAMYMAKEFVVKRVQKITHGKKIPDTDYQGDLEGNENIARQNEYLEMSTMKYSVATNDVVTTNVSSSSISDDSPKQEGSSSIPDVPPELEDSTECCHKSEGDRFRNEVAKPDDSAVKMHKKVLAADYSNKCVRDHANKTHAAIRETILEPAPDQIERNENTIDGHNPDARNESNPISDDSIIESANQKSETLNSGYLEDVDVSASGAGSESVDKRMGIYTEVTGQSETFDKLGLNDATHNHANNLQETMKESTIEPFTADQL